jgi:hypothetical protein
MIAILRDHLALSKKIIENDVFGIADNFKTRKYIFDNTFRGAFL